MALTAMVAAIVLTPGWLRKVSIAVSATAAKVPPVSASRVATALVTIAPTAAASGLPAPTRASATNSPRYPATAGSAGAVPAQSGVN